MESKKSSTSSKWIGLPISVNEAAVVATIHLIVESLSRILWHELCAGFGPELEPKVVA